MQNGAGGASVPAAKYLKDIMLEKDIHQLKDKIEGITGKPNPLEKGERVVAEVIGRDGDLLDRIYNVR